MIAQRQVPASGRTLPVVRGYRQRLGLTDGPPVVMPLPGRPAQFLEIYLDAPYRVSIDGGAFALAPEAVVVGPSSRCNTRLLISGSVATFQIAFQPSGFHRLFGFGMRELADRAAPADALGLASLTALVDCVRLASSFEARARVADDWIAHRLAWIRPQNRVDRIAHLVRRTLGGAPVEILAKRAGLSPRQLQRRFVDQVGLAPKLYGRTVRFEAVMNARQATPLQTWTDLSHRFGYFDQAHLLRDAHAFTGRPPGAWRWEIEMSDSS